MEKRKLTKQLKHIAFIMDGNGRWAKARNLPRTIGHKVALEGLIDIVEECSFLGIEVTSLYAFSTENWKRPKDEIKMLFSYLEIFLKIHLKRLIKDNIKLLVSGELERLPKSTQKAINKALDATSKLDGMVLNICLSYGGRDEIVKACKALTTKCLNGELNVEDITESIFEKHLFTKGLPNVDLLVRTSGEQRTSNFLPWQLAYSEMIFYESPWPDYHIEDLYKCLDIYENRNRRFGGLKNE